VTFRYRPEIDPDGIPQFAVNATLLNEFIKEHRKVEDLQMFVAKQ